jgi:hypothetical protein
MQKTIELFPKEPGDGTFQLLVKPKQKTAWAKKMTTTLDSHDDYFIYTILK